MVLEEMLAYNKAFVEAKEYEAYITHKLPKLNVAILSCMDTRLTKLLPNALGIKNGDVKIIKNAGALIAHPWGSAMRSLVLGVYELDVHEIFVIAHKDCGLRGLHAAQVLSKVAERSLEGRELELLRNAGIDLDLWLTGFECPEDSVRNTVDIIKKHPLIPPEILVHGLIMDPVTGALELICRDGVCECS